MRETAATEPPGFAGRSPPGQVGCADLGTLDGALCVFFLLSKRNASVLALTAILLAGCAETPLAGSGASPEPSAPPSPSAEASREPPSRILALTEQGDIVVIDRESAQQVRVVASFPPYEDPEVSAGSFWPVDVTALPDGRVLLATCCEPAAGLLYVLGEYGRQMENQDLFAVDAAADPAGERLATGEIIGLVIRPLPGFTSPTTTLDLPTGQVGLAPEDLSWSPQGNRVLFTIGGRLGVVDASSRSLSEAIYAECPAWLLLGRRRLHR
jgi:hypothetical protein